MNTIKKDTKLVSFFIALLWAYLLAKLSEKVAGSRHKVAHSSRIVVNYHLDTLGSIYYDSLRSLHKFHHANRIATLSCVLGVSHILALWRKLRLKQLSTVFFLVSQQGEPTKRPSNDGLFLLFYNANSINLSTKYDE